MNANNSPQLAVIILNWNGLELLKQFLPSVVAHTPANKAEIIVADNGSTDESLAWLHMTYPTIRTIELDQNYGFAEGYNRAIQEVDHPYVCLLNSDIEVTQNWINRPLEILGSNHKIAAVQPKIRSYHNKSSFEYAGAAGGYIDYLGYPFCRGRIFDHVEIDNGQYDNECDIFWASGAALFVKSDLYKKINGLDEQFFAHMEEIDLAWRLQNLGYKIHYTFQSTVYHVGGASLQTGSPKKTYLNFRNNLLMLYKNLPEHKCQRVLLSRMILDGLSAVQFLIKGQVKHTQVIYKAHKDFRSMRQKYVINSNINTLPKTIYPYSIVKRYFILRNKTYKQLKH